MKTVGIFAYGETGFSALKSLIPAYKITWIIVPPKEAGLTTSSSAVEKLAEENNIPVIKTNTASEVKALIAQNIPDTVVISSYNKILPNEILSLTRFINVHHGNLPRFRGRANINWAIILGRDSIGLTFHNATIDLDAGNIFAQYKVPITDTDSVKTVYDKVNIIIEKHLPGIVKRVIDGFAGVAQKGQATYCCTRMPNDGLVDWTKNTKDIYNLIRAVTKPYPGAFTYFKGKKLVVWESEIPEKPRVYEGKIPGRVVAIHKEAIEVLTGDGSILIKRILYDGTEENASNIIRSISVSLGIDIVALYEDLQMLRQKYEGKIR